MKTKFSTMAIALIITGLLSTGTAYGRLNAENDAKIKWEDALIIDEYENIPEIEEWMKDTGYFVSLFDVTEESITLEDWMKDRKYFRRSVMNEEKEKEPVIEKWMTDPNYFKPAKPKHDQEVAPVVEPWMTDTGYFRSISYVAEESQEIEPWMRDLKYFKRAFMADVTEKEAVIESWMTDTGYFKNQLKSEKNEKPTLIYIKSADYSDYREATKLNKLRLSTKIR